MDRWSLRWWVLAAALFMWPLTCPAPLVYTPGEGWSYEPVGGTKWQRARAKDQFEVAQESFDEKRYNVTIKACRRVVKIWPLSDYAPQAQYLMGRAYEARKMDERAFKSYQQLLEKYPKLENYQEVLARQFDIANRYLAGQWFKLWGYIPFFPSMTKTADMYEKVVRNGPYSDIAPQAQMNIGAAHEKRSAGKVEKFSAAVKAYERAADRYHDQKTVASEALYKAGLAYFKMARKSDYDQSLAGQAIATFGDFMTLYPDDPRLPEVQKMVSQLRTEQARGSFMIARFYEKRRNYDGAAIYYNEVQVKDAESSYAEEARKRMDAIKQRTSASAK